MRKILFILIIFLFIQNANAFHLKGGWIHYQYISTNNTNNTNKYTITVQQFLDLSSSTAQIDAVVSLGVFDNVKDSLLNVISIQLTSSSIITKSYFPPCVSPLPVASSVGYRIDEYVTTVDLPINNNGYKLAVQRCCRVSGIVNIAQSDTVGFTYNTSIPGLISGLNFANNSNPAFIFNDTVLICHNANFSFPFKAVDNDGDSLVYSFCTGLLGGSGGFSGNPKPNPPANPPYLPIPYSAGFGATTPFGTGVSINANTGIISGIAPNETGVYSIAVCAAEYRAGILISKTKKEIHINVVNCELSAVLLDTAYLACNSYSVSFSNQSASAGVTSYTWDFGDTKTATDTSTQPLPTYTYNDTGTYKVKLKVTAPYGCVDSAISVVKVYPIFPLKPHIAATCVLNPIFFIDSNFVKYKALPIYKWNFGDPASASNNTSNLYNPVHQYSNYGYYRCLITINSNPVCSSKDSIILLLLVANSSTQNCTRSATPPDTILVGTTITFTANAINSGVNPSYQWYKNGQVLVGENSIVYSTATLQNNDSINCQITSTDTCVANKTVISKAYFVKTKPSFSVSGRFVNKLNKPIKNIQLVNNTNINYFNNNYEYVGAVSSNIVLKPTKNNDIAKKNGVSAFDIVLIQNHILNKIKLNSPYKIIAADVTNDKKVSSFDIIFIKRLILGIDTTFAGNRMWAFVDSSYVFPDTTNPFPYKDSISFSNLTSSKTNQTFIGVKLGDVNYDWVSTTAKGVSVKSLELIVNSKLEVINGEMRIPITVKNFKELTALQYTLNFNNKQFEFVGIENNKLGIEFSSKQANTTGNISFLWADANSEPKSFEDGSLMFELILKPKDTRFTMYDTRFDEILTINNSITEIEAWDKDFRHHNIILTKQQTNNLPIITNNYFSVYPNPTKGLVNIDCVSAKTVAVIDALGKIVYQSATNINHLSLNVKPYSKGLYIVQITFKDGTIKNEKLIVE